MAVYGLAEGIVSVGKDAAGRGCVAVGGGGSGPLGRATPHRAEPTLRCHAVPCRNQSSSAAAAGFLGRSP